MSPHPNIDDPEPSQKKPSEQERQQATNKVRSALLELTANLFRVVRGAGSSEMLLSQAVEVVKTSKQYRDVVGHWVPAHELDAMLRINRIHNVDPYSSQIDLTLEAEIKVMKGALQTIASRILSQSAQERAGEIEMYRGIDRLNEIRTKQPERRDANKPKTVAEAMQAARFEGKIRRLLDRK